ncbi:comE operon protein 1 [bacterium BMS3Abin09]|nr:comE operon protein 1 [bacterium BMS3Abin09]GBE41042.1 comE operon protein 1 [bacterium BMS3Bbin09]HDN95261.1 ComEA family DNA-binding protein [Nitrospirota bacterium]HDO67569.1 ComEA family DNA-binding protein [Nitrospirota bacterium]HEW81743.1 ComEA family DNA-binding protein [Nitrospirota bacterium]
MKRNIFARICVSVVILFAAALFLGSMAFADNNAGQAVIDLNAATVKELAALPGVGKKRAQAIVTYRTENGKFESIDEIMKIDGIGKKTLTKIRERVIVE